MTAPTQATAREAVELPKPYDEWTAYAKRAGLLDENGVAPQDGRMNTQTAYYAYSAAWNRLYPLLAAKQEEVDKMREDAERYRFLQGATESQVWQLFDRAETDEHLNKMIDEARAALSPSQQGE